MRLPARNSLINPHDPNKTLPIATWRFPGITGLAFQQGVHHREPRRDGRTKVCGIWGFVPAPECPRKSLANFAFPVAFLSCGKVLLMAELSKHQSPVSRSCDLGTGNRGADILNWGQRKGFRSLGSIHKIQLDSWYDRKPWSFFRL